MYRNRNGYWMSPKFDALFAPDDGAGAGGIGAGGDGNAPAGDDGNAAGNEPEGAGNSGAGDNDGKDTAEKLNAEIARLKAEMAKQKQSLDSATSEAAKYRRELNSKKTQEQLAAEEQAEAAEKAAKELEELRKEVAKGKTIKTVMGKLGLDEETAGSLSECLYGAADIDNALLQIQQAWTKKEKALRMEFGKITGPGAGADSNSPEAQAIKRASEIGKARNALEEQALKARQAYMQ